MAVKVLELKQESSESKEYIARFIHLIKKKVYKPKVITEEELLAMYQGIYEETNVLIASDGFFPVGIAIYDIIPASKLRNFDETLNELFGTFRYDNKFFREIIFSEKNGFKDYSGKGSMIELEKIETFPRKKGVGTLFIERLKNIPDSEGIIGRSRDDSREFYIKKDFQGSKIYQSCSGLELMLWINPDFKSNP